MWIVLCDCQNVMFGGGLYDDQFYHLGSVVRGVVLWTVMQAFNLQLLLRQSESVSQQNIHIYQELLLVCMLTFS